MSLSYLKNRMPLDFLLWAGIIFEFSSYSAMDSSTGLKIRTAHISNRKY